MTQATNTSGHVLYPATQLQSPSLNTEVAVSVRRLANWLTLKSNNPCTSSKIDYHLNGRAALMGLSLISLADAIGRVALGCIAFIGYLSTFGYWQSSQAFSIDQMKKAASSFSIALSCFRSIPSPKNLVNKLPALAAPAPGDISWGGGRRAPVEVAETSARSTSFNSSCGVTAAENANIARSQALRHGTENIADKLRRQFEHAQKQAAQESDGAFAYLPAPSNFKAEAHREVVGEYEVGICHYIGRRPTMEDQHLTASFNLVVGGRTYPIQLFGIFDGHGGDQAAIYVRENLERVLHDTLNEFCKDGLTDEDIWNALKITFFQLKQEHGQRRSGTTATMAMILDGKLWTANVGDSRTILDNGIQLSEDAKPSDPRYQKGIKNRGGIVVFGRVNGNLAVARAIGDHDVGAVSARPKITVLPLSEIPKGTHLILTCDGIYDVASTRQVANAVKGHNERPLTELARNIVYSAFMADSMDNLSALVVKL